MKRLVKKSERELTNIEYEEIKKKVEEKTEYRNKYVSYEEDPEMVVILEKLDTLDKSDSYVQELFRLILPFLVRTKQQNLISRFYSEKNIDEEDEKQEDSVILSNLKKAEKYVQSKGSDEKYIDEIISPIINWDNKEELFRVDAMYNVYEIITDFLQNEENKVSEQFLTKYYEYINYYTLFSYSRREIPEHILKKAIDKGLISWEEIVRRQSLSEEFIKENWQTFVNKTSLIKSLVRNDKIDLSGSFISEYIQDLEVCLDISGLIDFFKIFGNKLNDEETNHIFNILNKLEDKEKATSFLRITKEIEEYMKNKVFEYEFEKLYFWEDTVSANPLITEEFIERNRDKLSIVEILKRNRNLSEEFILENIKDIQRYSWTNICTHSELSEKFIEDNENYVNWRAVANNQKMSIEFIMKHKDKIKEHIISLRHNKNIDQKKMKKYKVYEILEKLI